MNIVYRTKYIICLFFTDFKNTVYTMRSFRALSIFIYLITSLRKSTPTDPIKQWWMVRMTEMDKRVPPLPPRKVPSRVQCGLMCCADPTCTSFSYGKNSQSCILQPELIRPYDISMSHNQPDFVTFNVHQSKLYIYTHTHTYIHTYIQSHTHIHLSVSVSVSVGSGT